VDVAWPRHSRSAHGAVFGIPTHTEATGRAQAVNSVPSVTTALGEKLARVLRGTRPDGQPRGRQQIDAYERLL
jgi:hypothetical protein